MGHDFLLLGGFLGNVEREMLGPMNSIQAPKSLQCRVERRARPRPINLHNRAELYGLEVSEVDWEEWRLCLELLPVDRFHRAR